MRVKGWKEKHPPGWARRLTKLGLSSTGPHTPPTSNPLCSSFQVLNASFDIMAEPEKNLDKLREEQAEDDADLLADLDKESKEFDKVPSAGKQLLALS